jgi:transaldolase
MKVFVDSADRGLITEWLEQGVVDGVTTNPSIVFKGGVTDLEEAVRALAILLRERPLSVEVTSNDRDVMLEQARELATWGRNIVVKVPVVNQYGESCLGVMHRLVEEGLAINATAILSFNQALLASKAGASYVSIFAGRVADEGNDPAVTIHNVRRWLDDWALPTRIIVGSIRTVMDIQAAALAGAHVITIPPAFLAKMVDHRYTRETVRQFVEDGEKTMEEMHKAKAAVGLPFPERVV